MPNDIVDAGSLWKNFSSTNAGINKRYKIYIGYLAQKFNIAVREHFYFRNFPCVRCKADVEGQNVYYVPDDEEYFSVKVNLSRGDKYCWSAEDAEYVGFNRLHLARIS